MKLPDPKIYEEQLEFMPYKLSLDFVLEYVYRNMEGNWKGNLTDFVSETGYLLWKIAEKRPDINLTCIDNNKIYLNYAAEKFPNIDFKKANVLSYKSKEKQDIIVCTGSLHHSSYEKQEKAFRKMASMLKQFGFLLLSDCYIEDFSTETRRKLNVGKVDDKYLKETIQNGAPNSVIEATK